MPIGGIGLFCLVLKEGHEELIEIHFFALGPVDAGEQRGDDAFLKLKFFTEAGHFCSKVCDLLVFLFDAFMRAGGVPNFDLLRLLSYFKPGALETIAQVDAVGEHGERSGFEDEGLAIAFDVLGPTEIPALKTFCDTPVSSSVKVEDFDEVATLVGEEEGGSTGGVDPDGVAGDFGEAVEGLAHVTGLKSDVDFEVAVEGEHNGRSGEGFEEFGEKSDLVA